MERGAVLFLLFLTVFLVLSRPSGSVPAVLRASGVQPVQIPASAADCCLIPPNRGLYPAR